MDCIFCKIIKGEIPCYKIYEDENVLAFLDIAKEGYGHTLVVPKKHHDNIVDIPNEELNKCMDSVRKIANHYVKNCGFTGFNIVVNTNPSAGQSVMHLHIHIIPRKEGDGNGVWHIKEDKTDLEEVRKHLEVK